MTNKLNNKVEEAKRNYKLDMGYESMWSLIEDLSSEELKEEAERLKNEIYENNKKEREFQENKGRKLRKLSVLKEILEEILEERENRVLAKILPTNEHKKLLKRMSFKEYKDGGDYVFIGCDGKRPFRNSDVYRDVAEILDWKLPNDDLSDEQREKANRLLKEYASLVLREKTRETFKPKKQKVATKIK